MIRKTRKLVGRWYVMMPLCVLMLSFTTACSSNGSLVRPEAPTIDDEALVRGIFFAEGPVAERITAYNGVRQLRDESLSTDQKIAIAKAQDAILATIKTNDPGFISSFGKAMRSGDHLLIQSTLKDASPVFMDAAQLYAKERSVELSDLQAQLEEYSASDIQPSDWSKDNLERLIAQKETELEATRLAAAVAEEDIIDVAVEVEVAVYVFVLLVIAIADIVLAIANPSVEDSQLKGELLIQNIVTDLELSPTKE